MKTHEKLTDLADRVKTHVADENEVLRELRDVLHDFDHCKGIGNYTANIEGGINVTKRGFHHHDARDVLLFHIRLAAEIAGSLYRSSRGQ